jgi:mRNA-degrading endonuclease RelE of RelBE toxin-antitoxin system
MIKVLLTDNFEKTYKHLSEITRKQIKLAIKKLSNSPSDKSLRVKKIDNQKYESFVSNNCKLIWNCDKGKGIIYLIDIYFDQGTNSTIKKLDELDREIKVRERMEKNDA